MECGSNRLNGDCGLITYWWSVSKMDGKKSSDLLLGQCGSNRLNGDCGLITYWWSVGKIDVRVCR